MFEELEFKDLVENGKLISLSKVPFVAMMLSEMIIKEKENIGGTMATDSQKYIYFDPKFEEYIDDLNYHCDTDKECYLALVIVHEIFHKIQRDNIFFKMVGEEGIHYLYNIAADSYINDIIIEFFDVTGLLYSSAVPRFKENSITTESLFDIIKKYDTKNKINITLKDLRILSNIERYNLLLKASQEHRDLMQKVMDELQKKYGDGDLIPGDGDDGEEINKNGKNGKNGIGVPRELAEAVKADMVTITQSMLNKIKSIGKTSAQFEELVGELLEPKIDWALKLKKLIREGSQRIESGEEDEDVDKRLTYLHGFVYKTYHSYKPNFCTIIDTSGSMSGSFNQAASEMAVINKNNEMRLIQIDTKIKSDEILKNGDLVHKIKNADFGFSGLGGTELYKAFERLYEDKIKGTIIVLMSDYELWGEDGNKIKRYEKLLRKRNNTVIHCKLTYNGDVEIFSKYPE